jgi:hypothetical protein
MADSFGRIAFLPAANQMPMTYEVGSKQDVVPVDGGHGSFGTKLGYCVRAYALPERRCNKAAAPGAAHPRRSLLLACARDERLAFDAANARQAAIPSIASPC